MTDRFPFEELEIWQDAVCFADKCLGISEKIGGNTKHYRLISQLESACTSVSLNIAEGKGRYSKKEFAHFLYIARGSLFETITILEILKNRKWIPEQDLIDIRKDAISLGKRINAFINAIKKV